MCRREIDLVAELLHLCIISVHILVSIEITYGYIERKCLRIAIWFPGVAKTAKGVN